jgi:glyoxylase-like metal-dependent hydrolase (beta-lactamase superfamily II)
MAESPRTVTLGAARVTILNAGDLFLRMGEEMNVPEEARRSYAADLDHPRRYPSQSVLIELENVTVLVDVGDYAATVPLDAPHRPRGYTPPPGIAAQLAALGVHASAVQHVVITHAHWDHFAGITTPQGSDYVPTFPGARCYLGHADWEREEMRTALQNAVSLEARTFGALEAHGLVVPVTGDQTLTLGIAIRPAPGETPGHQIVRVSSAGQTLYCLGDLFHSPVEVEHPDWMVSWAEPETTLASRNALITTALAEHALLVAAHIATVGRLERTGDGLRWVAVG